MYIASYMYYYYFYIIAALQTVNTLCRFSKDDIPRLYVALAIPDEYKCVQGTTTTGMEALLVLLRRLAYPNRLCDLVKLFGRSKTELSLIFNVVCMKKLLSMCKNKIYLLPSQIINDVHHRFNDLLSSFDHVWLDKQQFASAIEAKGAPLSQCIGFIDGTVRPIARPTVNQRIMFSGHKRVHCVKFQV